MMNHTTYTGSGPYCYADSLRMILGDDAPSSAVIEFATGSPFGMEFIGEKLVFFDPYGWSPLDGIEKALEAMGWQSTEIIAKDEDDAATQLRTALKKGPVFVGPVALGHLTHSPTNKGIMDADHYIVALRINGPMVEIHDPAGHPYATLPLADLLKAWKIEQIAYGKPYTMRTDFRLAEKFSEEDIIRRSIPSAAAWISAKGSHDDMPPKSAANASAAMRLARLVETEYTPSLRGHLTYFAVRVGARRAADAATCLARVGLDEAAGVMERQARLIGSLQHPLTVGRTSAAADTLRELAETYGPLEEALAVQLR